MWYMFAYSSYIQDGKFCYFDKNKLHIHNYNSLVVTSSTAQNAYVRQQPVIYIFEIETYVISNNIYVFIEFLRDLKKYHGCKTNIILCFQFIKLKITFYNTISNGNYERKPILENCKILMFKFTKCR